MFEAGVPQELQHARYQSHVGAAQNAEPQPVGVLVGDRAYRCLGCLPQARINDFHASVAQATRDYLDAPIMSVEADFGEDYTDGRDLIRHGLPLGRSIVASEHVGQRIHDLAHGAADAGGIE